MLPGTPLPFTSKGVSDTLDSSTAFPGAMSALTNLIPDPTTHGLWQPRPASLQLTNFTGFNTPAFISVLNVIGSRAYGMVSTARNAGKDEPFVYDIPTATFITITGVNAANTPTSPATTGTWNPPSLALVGSKMIFAHPGYTGAGGAFFGVLDITNPAAPTWTATNTSPTALVAPPQWVENFNGRCYFLVNPAGAQPGAYFSDSLNPVSITNASQILTFGDNVPLTVAAGLALFNQLGGIVQSLMIFKGNTNIFQVTGDAATSNLVVNSLNVATGTLAPNSVVGTEKGLLFMAPDGVRLIDFNAKISDPIGKDGDGVTAPFIYTLTPSRAAAGFNAGIYRITVQNGGAVGNPLQEWWYDFVRELWSGPHTSTVYNYTIYQNTFITAMWNQGAKLFQSDVQQSSTSTYVENGVQLVCNWNTSQLPDTDQMSEIAMIETTIHMALVAGVPVTVQAADQNGALLDSVVLSTTGAATVWGAFQWGQANWGGPLNSLYPRQVSWHQPLVFRRVQINVSCNAAPGLKIGRMHLRYQVLGYLQQDAAGTVAA